MLHPLYTAEKGRIAYQLHWSLTQFATTAWPATDSWRQSLGEAALADGVRILEFKLHSPTTGQFLVSTKPEAAPAQIVRSVKGRLQYLLRGKIPQLWRRHYSITSVGSANNAALQGYVGRQVEHQLLADARATYRLSDAQFHDPEVDLATPRASAHGRFLHSLHVVLVKFIGRLFGQTGSHTAAGSRITTASPRKSGSLNVSIAPSEKNVTRCYLNSSATQQRKNIPRMRFGRLAID
jgi:Transposase IS200 like